MWYFWYVPPLELHLFLVKPWWISPIVALFVMQCSLMIVVHKTSWCMMGIWWHGSSSAIASFYVPSRESCFLSYVCPRLNFLNVLPVVVLCLAVAGRSSPSSDMSAFHPADLKECAAINKKKPSLMATEILAFTYALFLWSPCHGLYMQWIQCWFGRRKDVC